MLRTVQSLGPALVALVFVVTLAPSAAGAFQLRRVAFSGAGVAAADTTVILRATLAEASAAVGVVADTARVLHQGFWLPPGAGVVHVDAPARPSIARTLSSPAPNPFPSATSVSYTLTRSGHVRVDIFDAAGRRIRRLLDETASPGVHRLTWDGTDDAGRAVASGVYHLRLDADGWRRTRKLVKLH